MKPGNATLDHLNRVRLYIGATTLADICNDNRKYIQSKLLTGKWQLRPTTPWPNQEKPTKLSWRVWRRFLRNCFAPRVPKNLTLDKDWRLDADLGLWTKSQPLTSRRAYFDSNRDTLYARNKNGSYSLYNRLQGHIYTYAPTKTDTDTLPQSAVFTPVKDVGETI
eukprot:4152261-Ditylum_brightwellii.AAC.1